MTTTSLFLFLGGVLAGYGLRELGPSIGLIYAWVVRLCGVLPAVVVYLLALGARWVAEQAVQAADATTKAIVEHANEVEGRVLPDGRAGALSLSSEAEA